MKSNPEPIFETYLTRFLLGTAVRGLISFAVFLFPFVATAADLQPKTLKAWDAYVRTANSRMQQRLQPSATFLWIDEEPGRAARVHNGEILALPASAHSPMKAPSGLIHHWIGAAFVPNVTIQDVLSVVRDYNRYNEFYRPTVMNSKAIMSNRGDDRFSMLLMNKALFVKAALDSEYESSYFQVDDHRWYSIAHTTHVQEIEGYGQPGERRLAENEGTGLIWRLSSITRFEERDGGVYIELEAMALSRDIPLSLHWFVEPIVRRVSRDSLTTSLRETEKAVNASELAHNTSPSVMSYRTLPSGQ